jgi:predicted porin
VKKSKLCAAVIGCAISPGFVAVAHAADDGSLTWNGITAYGIYDIGVAYQPHGNPVSQDWGNGLNYLIAKASNKSITTVAPNGLGQSRIGVKGKEDIADGLAFVFNAEIGFNPQSGNLADGPKSLTHNNGVAQANQTSASDSARAGQLFNGQAFGGLSSNDWGTLTLGRQNTLQLDNIGRYDPMGGSIAFSLLGFSGIYAGGGYTEDTRLDDSVKYTYKRDIFHGGLLYQFGKGDSSPGEAWQGNLGFDYAGFSVDGVYTLKKDAISAGSLSAAQIATGVPEDSLTATISDNEAYTLDASYSAGPAKLFAGYEHIHFENPSLPITAPFSGLGGYYFSIVSNTAFPHAKVLELSWLGARYSFTPDWDLTGAWYHLDQNSFKAGASCDNTSSAQCSGTENVYSLMTDYRWTKRFDTYAGVAFSKVSDGLASGFLHTSTADPMVGFRFKF